MLQSGAVHGLPHSSVFAALSRPWVRLMSRVPLLHLRLSLPLFELLIVNEPYADQATHGEIFREISQRDSGLGSRKASEADQFDSSLGSLPLLRLSVENIRIAGASSMSLFGAGLSQNVLAAPSSRHSKVNDRENCRISGSAERLHERLSYYILGENQQQGGLRSGIVTMAPEFLTCGGALVRLEYA